MRISAVSLALLLALPSAAAAQSPPTVFFEDMTFNEIRDLIQGGYRTAILPTGGTEQKGPHMALGEHNFVIAYTSDKIARALGNTLVAPVITYVPEGNYEPKSGHMRMAGTLSMPDDAGFTMLLEAAATSLKGSGFKTILLIGDSGGNQNGMKAVADKLTAAWQADGVKVLHIPDYYVKGGDMVDAYITKELGIPADQIGGHANISDTSQLMAVRPDLVRVQKMEPGNQTNGVSGDPRRASAQLGHVFLQFKVDAALAQIRQLTGQRGER
jgi:creatinine amidohydrolase/Fe(II)-dependent formamide hydrolase-like protein